MSFAMYSMVCLLLFAPSCWSVLC